MSQLIKLLVASTAVLVLTGCGGSSPDNGAAFVTEANRICANANRRLAAMPAINATAELLRTGPQEVSVTNSALAQLRTLTPPAGRRATVGQLISGLTQETALIQQVVAAVRTGNLKQGQSLAVKASALNASDRVKATSLGLTECTESVAPAPTTSSAGSG
jgi:hypothetical protein